MFEFLSEFTDSIESKNPSMEFSFFKDSLGEAAGLMGLKWLVELDKLAGDGTVGLLMTMVLLLAGVGRGSFLGVRLWGIGLRLGLELGATSLGCLEVKVGFGMF